MSCLGCDAVVFDRLSPLRLLLVVPEWPVSPLRAGSKFYAHAAFSTLRAHAAGKPNLQNGLIVDIRAQRGE